MAAEISTDFLSPPTLFLGYSPPLPPHQGARIHPELPGHLLLGQTPRPAVGLIDSEDTDHLPLQEFPVEPRLAEVIAQGPQIPWIRAGFGEGGFEPEVAPWRHIYAGSDLLARMMASGRIQIAGPWR